MSLCVHKLKAAISSNSCACRKEENEIDILFYHLETTSLTIVLPGLLEKSLQRGWKALIVSGAQDQLAPLNEALWTEREDSFIPHALSAGCEDCESEPILLSSLDEVEGVPGDGALSNPNQANILFMVHSGYVDVKSLNQFERCVAIFDGNDDVAIGAARDLWKRIRDANQNGDDAQELTYWRQSEQGRWEKQG